MKKKTVKEEIKVNLDKIEEIVIKTPETKTNELLELRERIEALEKELANRPR